MRFLDLDLDFFLNDNPYCSKAGSGRLGPEYKPWNVSKVRHFLEGRCFLSHNTPVPGRTVESHDRVIDFWLELIESGGLRVPFEVIHIDAHPDISVRNALFLRSGSLYIDPKRRLGMLEREQVHSGNYLTFAIAHGWIASLVWIPLSKTLKDLPRWPRDVRFDKNRGGDSLATDTSTIEFKSGVLYKILPWYRFKTSGNFDYMALSRSANFTPPESDALVPIIEGYMRQI